MKSNHWLSTIGSGVITVVMLALLGIAVALVLIPKLVGGISLTVLTGSMEPGIHPGDIVVTKGFEDADAADLEVGDVIVFLPYADDPFLVTHRITAKAVSQSGYSFVTQGDNNQVADPWNPVHSNQIRGTVLYTIPKLGYVKQWLGTHSAQAVTGIAIMLFGYAAISFVSGLRKSKADRSVSTARRALVAEP